MRSTFALCLIGSLSSIAAPAFAQQVSSPEPASSAPSVAPTMLAPIAVAPVSPPPISGRPIRGYRYVEVDDDGRTPTPPGAEHLRRRTRWPLVAGGAIFLGTWLFAGSSMFAGVTCTSTSGSGGFACSPWLDAWVWLPLAGPFIGASEISSTVHDTGWEALMIGDGILQNVGVALFVAGWFLPQRRVVRWMSPVYANQRERHSWSIVPTLRGAAVVGTF